MYGNANLDLGSEVLMWSSSLAFLGTVAPICSSLMMNLRMRKKVIIFLLINFIIKMVTFYPMIKYFGWSGAIISSIVSSLANITLALYTMGKAYHINYFKLFLRVMIMCLGLLAMFGAFSILDLFIDINVSGKLVLLLLLALYGIIGLAVYVLTTALFRIPQKIFKIEIRGF